MRGYRVGLGLLVEKMWGCKQRISSDPEGFGLSRGGPVSCVTNVSCVEDPSWALDLAAWLWVGQLPQRGCEGLSVLGALQSRVLLTVTRVLGFFLLSWLLHLISLTSLVPRKGAVGHGRFWRFELVFGMAVVFAFAFCETDSLIS